MFLYGLLKTYFLSFFFAEELQTLRESDARNKLQYEESQRRERILIRKLALKEQEIQVYIVSNLFYLFNGVSINVKNSTLNFLFYLENFISFMF